MDIRVPVGSLFFIYGALLVAYGLVGGDLEPRHMLFVIDGTRPGHLAGLNVNVATGTAMLLFGGTFLYLSRRGGSKIRPAMSSPQGRATEEREKRTGLEH
jgi:hypothetical protein